MYTYINEILKNRFYQHASVRDQFGYYEQQVADSRLSPFAAADRLIDEYLQSMDKS